MLGYWFYVEVSDKGTSAETEAGNCIALCLKQQANKRWVPAWYIGPRSGQVFCECVSAVFGFENSPVCGGTVHRDYISDNTRRVSEAEARAIHPRLFEYLDN